MVNMFLMKLWHFIQTCIKAANEGFMARTQQKERRQYLHCFHCQVALEDEKEWCVCTPVFDLSFSVCEECRQEIQDDPEYVVIACVSYPMLGQMMKEKNGGAWVFQESASG